MPKFQGSVFIAMSTLNFCNSKSISRSKEPPAHYTLKIDSFSLLLENSIERYESREFESGGYRWNLVVYPNGNNNKNVKEHLSLYLAMAASNSLQRGWEVYAIVRLFILDQNNDNYMILQDVEGKERRFHGVKRELGFDQFIPLKALNDASNGFLVDDTCVFGAEVFICKERAKDQGECLRMIKDPITYKRTFKIDNVSKLDDVFAESKEFITGDQKWTIRVLLNGKGPRLGAHLSVYLALSDLANLSPGGKIYAKYTFRVVNQVNSKRIFGRASNWFSAMGRQHGLSRYMTFINFKYLGFLLKDNCIIEAKVAIHGITDDL